MKKTCTKCNIEKEFNDFSPLKKGKFNKHQQCKKCLNEYAKNKRLEKMANEPKKIRLKKPYDFFLTKASGFISASKVRARDFGYNVDDHCKNLDFDRFILADILRESKECNRCGVGLFCKVFGTPLLSFNKNYATNLLVIDHIKPISHGGELKLSNIQTICILCNAQKRRDENLNLKDPDYNPIFPPKKVKEIEERNRPIKRYKRTFEDMRMSFYLCELNQEDRDLGLKFKGYLVYLVLIDIYNYILKKKFRSEKKVNPLIQNAYKFYVYEIVFNHFQIFKNLVF